MFDHVGMKKCQCTAIWRERTSCPQASETSCLAVMDRRQKPLIFTRSKHGRCRRLELSITDTLLSHVLLFSSQSLCQLFALKPLSVYLRAPANLLRTSRLQRNESFARKLLIFVENTTTRERTSSNGRALD